MNRVIQPDALCSLDFEVYNLNAFIQNWRTGAKYSFLKSPRREQGLTLFTHCSAIYTMEDGSKLHAERGDLVYLKQDARYQVEFLERDMRGPATLLVNFKIRESGEDVMLSEEPVSIFQSPAPHESIHAMRRMTDMYNSADYLPGLMKAELYEFLVSWSRNHRQMRLTGRFRVLSPAVERLNDPRDSTSIRELAEICHLSESGFRKMFWAYAGRSPSQYRIDRQIDQAQRLLQSEVVSVEEVAHAVGISDVNYFSRLFHKKTGHTPSQVRKE